MAFDVAGIGTCVWDLATGRIEWDQRRRDLAGVGCGPADLDGLLRTVHEEDRAAVRAAVGAAVTEGRSYAIEYRSIRPDGRVVWVSSKGQVLRDPQTGRPATFVAVTTDVTARRQAEDALRESERRFRELADTVPEIVWTAAASPEGSDRRNFNRRFYQYTGFDPAALPPRPWGLILHPADVDAAGDAWVKHSADPRPYELENRWRRADGEYRWFLSRAVPVWDGGGRLAGWVGCATDIHDRKVAEEKLRASQETLDLALDIAAVGTWQWDVATGASTWDARARAIWGIPADVPGHRENLLRVIHPDDHAALARVDAENVQRLNEYAVQYRVIHPGGAVRWISSRGRVIREGRTGRVVRVNGVCWDVTDRRRAEDALRASQQTLALALDIADLGTWEWDVARGVSTWSSRCRSIFGLTPDEPIGPDTFAKLVHPEDRERAVGRREPVPTGNDYAAEYRVIRPDGQVRWVASRGRTTRDASGRALRVTGVVSDVTERKGAEEALRDSERHYRELAEAMPHIVWTADAAGRIDYVNERAADLSDPAFTGPPDLGAPWDWTALLHPDDAPGTRAAWSEAVATGAPGFQIEHRLRRPGGGYRWYLARAVSARDDGGRVVRWFGSHTDVDQQKRAADDRRFLDELNEVLVRPDPATVLRSAAEAVVRHLGVDRCGFAEVDEGAGVLRVVAQLDARSPAARSAGQPIPLARVNPAALALLRAGRVRVLRDTRREVPEEFRDVFGPAGVGAVIGVPVVRDGELVCTAFVDTTAPRRWRQEEVDLLRLVAERAWSAHERARLTEAERAARRTAEEASRAKDQFLAVLSHELRTPLNPVLASVSAMEQDAAVGESVRAELAMVRRNVELEARLIDDLLDLTRIGRGKLDLRRHVVDAHALVRHVVQICAPDAGEKHIRVDVRLDAPRHHVNADPARLQQVYWNLLKNAIKFTPAGGRVTVDTAADDGGGAFVVTVADSGIGIPAEFLPKIFDAFEQASPEINRRFGGLGLGLAISKGLVDAHGGVLDASSPGVGKGSTFRVTMPAAAESPATEPEPVPAPPPTPAARSLRILLVEDHADTARVMTRLLRKLGHEVTATGSVGEAADAVAAGEFDLLLSDLGLPDASGHELMKSLRATRPGLVGVAISGYGTDDDIQKSVEAGFADHITKPINIQILEDVLHRHASRRR